MNERGNVRGNKLWLGAVSQIWRLIRFGGKGHKGKEKECPIL